MRLLHVKSFKLSSFLPDETPPYAILSHRWGDGEISFADIQEYSSGEASGSAPPAKGSTISSKPGFAKVRDCCQRASHDGWEYWYEKANVCYVFLPDVPSGDLRDSADPCHDAFKKSQWFTRGWTLQELLAPTNLEFYSSDWTKIGAKKTSVAIISSITGIDPMFIAGEPLTNACIAERLSWAATREVTRGEDNAYCLLGILEVNMPLLYGEGPVNAFQRLQEELITMSDDESLFAWEAPTSPSGALLAPGPIEAGEIPGQLATATTGILAESPASFRACRTMTRAEFGSMRFFTKANGFIRMTLNIEKARNMDNGAVFYAVLRCRHRHDLQHALAIPVTSRDGICYRIRGPLKSMRVDYWKTRNLVGAETLLSPRHGVEDTRDVNGAFVIRFLPKGYKVTSIYPKSASVSGPRSNMIATGLRHEDLRRTRYNGPDIERFVLVENEIDLSGKVALPLRLLVQLRISKGLRNRLIFTARTVEVVGDTPESAIFDKAREHFKSKRPKHQQDTLTTTVSIQELVCGTCFVVDIEKVPFIKSIVLHGWCHLRYLPRAILGGGELWTVCVVISMAFGMFYTELRIPTGILGFEAQLPISISSLFVLILELIRHLLSIYGGTFSSVTLNDLRTHLARQALIVAAQQFLAEFRWLLLIVGQEEHTRILSKLVAFLGKHFGEELGSNEESILLPEPEGTSPASLFS